MNSAFLLTALMYAPICAVVIGISILVVALMQRSTQLRDTSYGFFVIAALFAIPAFLSGQGREIVDVAQAANNMSINPMKLSLLATEILGSLSFIALVLERLGLQFFAPCAELIVVIGALTTASLTYSTNLGSHVR